MALALNVFKTETKVGESTLETVYTAPAGYTGVVLLSQACNTGGATLAIDFIHSRGATNTEILSGFAVQPNDTISMLQGKLTLQPADSIKVRVTGDSPSAMKFTFSILETLN